MRAPKSERGPNSQKARMASSVKMRVRVGSLGKVAPIQVLKRKMTRKQAMPLKDLGDDAAAMLMLWWKAPKKCLLKVPTGNRFF